MRFVKFFTFLFLLNSGLGFAQSNDVKALQAYRDANQTQILEEYMELLKLPNNAADIENITRNADFLIEAFKKRGVELEKLTLPDKPDVPPIIFGELKNSKSDRTLLVYVHYDGQPADPENWANSPWDPKIYNGIYEPGDQPLSLPKNGEKVNPEWRIYARSASDDKAPFPAILATLDALREAKISLTSNIKFFFEGEEEAGSIHLQEYLEHYKDKLSSDFLLFFDGPIHQSGKPRIVFGARGDANMEITVYGPSRPLHSGHYGGWAPVPGQLLVNLLSTMKNDTGEILIEGFNEDTAPITQSDRKAFETLPDFDSEIRQDLGLKQTEFHNRLLAEGYMYPTFTIRGLKSGNVGELARNVIPTTAEASLDIRLAKGNDPNKILDKVEAHIEKQGFHIVREDPDKETRMKYSKIAKVERDPNYKAVRTPLDNKMAQKIVKAVETATGEDIILSPTSGGSLPLSYFVDVLDTPVITIPIANYDNNQHAENENIRIGNIWYGIDVYAGIFTMP